MYTVSLSTTSTWLTVSNCFRYHHFLKYSYRQYPPPWLGFIYCQLIFCLNLDRQSLLLSTSTWVNCQSVFYTPTSISWSAAIVTIHLLDWDLFTVGLSTTSTWLTVSAYFQHLDFLKYSCHPYCSPTWLEPVYSQLFVYSTSVNYSSFGQLLATVIHKPSSSWSKAITVHLLDWDLSTISFYLHEIRSTVSNCFQHQNFSKHSCHYSLFRTPTSLSFIYSQLLIYLNFSKLFELRSTVSRCFQRHHFFKYSCLCSPRLGFILGSAYHLLQRGSTVSNCLQHSYFLKHSCHYSPTWLGFIYSQFIIQLNFSKLFELRSTISHCFQYHYFKKQSCHCYCSPIRLDFIYSQLFIHLNFSHQVQYLTTSECLPSLHR